MTSDAPRRDGGDIAFVMSNFIGDAVLASGVVEAWRGAYADRRIDIIGPLPVLRLFEAVPPPISFYRFEKLSWNRHWFRLWRDYRRRKLDYVIDFRRSFVGRTLSGRRIEGPSKDLPVHQVVKYKALSPPGAAGLPVPKLRTREAVRRDRGLPSGLAVLAVGSSWPAKSWPEDSFAELGKRVIASGSYRVAVAAEAGCGRAERVYSRLPAKGRVDLIGKYSIVEIVEILRRAAVTVSNDSGLMHIAAAVGCPVVALFGPTSEVRTGPWTGDVSEPSKSGSRVRVLRSLRGRREILADPGYSRDGPSALGDIGVEEVLSAFWGVAR